jgi:hypothetical protein
VEKSSRFSRRNACKRLNRAEIFWSTTCDFSTIGAPCSFITNREEHEEHEGIYFLKYFLVDCDEETKISWQLPLFITKAREDENAKFQWILYFVRRILSKSLAQFLGEKMAGWEGL